jgi:hypothetical protein
MVHHLFSRRESKPDFPERLDLPQLSDKEAEAALGLLRLLVSGDQADVYTRPWRELGQRWKWNVWVSAESRRYELETWAISVLFPNAAPEGPDAA